MATGGVRRLKRSLPSCLRRPAQRTDFFHGLVTVRFADVGSADDVAWTTGVSFVGERPLRDNTMDPQILPSYTLLNSAVSVYLADLQIVLAATNLTNEWFIVDDFSSQNAGNFGVPRRFTVQLRYSFGTR